MDTPNNFPNALNFSEFDPNASDELIFLNFLNDEEFRKKIIENGNKHVENYFENKGNSSKYLADVLKNIRC